MTERLAAPWMKTNLKDMLGNEFKVGDKVAKTVTSGRSSNITICDITRIENEKIYLNESKVPIVYPCRLLIVNKIFE